MTTPYRESWLVRVFQGAVLLVWLVLVGLVVVVALAVLSWAARELGL